MVLMTSPGNLPNHYRRFARKLGTRMRGAPVVLVRVPAKVRTTCPIHWGQPSVAANRRFARGMGCNYSVYKVPTNVVRLSRNNFLTDFIFSALAGSFFRQGRSVRSGQVDVLQACHRHQELRFWRFTVRSTESHSRALVPDAFPYRAFLVIVHERPVRDTLQTSSNNVEHTPTQGLSGKS